MSVTTSELLHMREQVACVLPDRYVGCIRHGCISRSRVLQPRVLCDDCVTCITSCTSGVDPIVCVISEFEPYVK